MQEDRRVILEMLANGQVTADEAERLLELTKALSYIERKKQTTEPDEGPSPLLELVEDYEDVIDDEDFVFEDNWDDELRLGGTPPPPPPPPPLCSASTAHCDTTGATSAACTTNSTPSNHETGCQSSSPCCPLCQTKS